MTQEATAPTPTSLSETDFGPLALWLALTTNQGFTLAGEQPGETPAQSIARTTSIDLATVQSFVDNFTGNDPLTVSLTTKADVFNFVRQQFQNLAKKVMTGGFYPEGGCPRKLKEVGQVAALGASQLQS